MQQEVVILVRGHRRLSSSICPVMSGGAVLCTATLVSTTSKPPWSPPLYTPFIINPSPLPLFNKHQLIPRERGAGGACGSLVKKKRRKKKTDEEPTAPRSRPSLFIVSDHEQRGGGKTELMESKIYIIYI